MSEQGSSSNSSSAAPVDLSEIDAKCIQSVVGGGALVNQRQCEDLSSKLSKTILNIQELVNRGASSILFRSALENLNRHVKKAKALVSECAKEDWCAAAVFQWGNENAFREILLDIGFCYNAIYGLAKSNSIAGWIPPEDLRKSSILLEAASHSDVDKDKEDLLERLHELANGTTSIETLDYIRPGRVALKQSVAQRQSLAHHLYQYMYWKSNELKACTLKAYPAIMWSKAAEPDGTWGNFRLLGSGSGATGVGSTTWLGIPCAKKEFHGSNIEGVFLKEAGILAHLKHPCIVEFMCCGNGTKKGDRFICMELMEMSLFDLIEWQKEEMKVPFTVGVVVDLMVQMARGVCYLHGEGVAHRDLKPQNVVVKRMNGGDEGDHYCVKMVDFGVSKGEVEVSQFNTMTCGSVGTGSYRAPEVLPKANCNGKRRVKWMRADAYSFAMTCAHLLCLEVPFEGMGAPLLYDEVVMNGRRPMIPDMYPKELVELLKDCWKTSPHLRPSFTEICVRLEKIRYNACMKSHLTTLDSGLEKDEEDCNDGVDFIKLKMNAAFKPPISDGVEEESDIKDYVSIISCTCGCALQLLPRPLYSGGIALCNVCWRDIDGEVYHCEACQVDAHTHCVEIRDEVEVSFHDHTLHLLVQDYYMDKPDVTCYICEESLQHSKWVYRCEECDIDVHALCSMLCEKIRCRQIHDHGLVMRQGPFRKGFTCESCNGEVKKHTWNYACSRQGCGIYFHPLCTIIPRNPFCIFDTSHRLTLVRRGESFYCARCGTFGASYSYHCSTCDVDIHLDCLDIMVESNEEKWIRAYETFMLENESIDHHRRMIMLLELVNKVPADNAFEGSSSSTSHLPQEVITEVQPSIMRLNAKEQLSLGLVGNDANLQRQIVAQIMERMKAKKIAAEKGKQKLSTDLLEMLEKLEHSLVGLRGSWSNMTEVEDQSLAALHEKLVRRQDLVKDQMVMQLQSRMNQAPRIVLFFKLRREKEKWVREILTTLQGDIEEVGFNLLCEEPGHEHVIPGTARKLNNRLGEDKKMQLQAMVAGGLDIVRRVLSTLQPQDLKSVTAPRLGVFTWDFGSMEAYGNGSMDECEVLEKVEVVKRAEISAAQWFRERQESYGRSMLKIHGLQRVQYTVTSREDEVWKHRRGNVAWVCKEHVDSGLKGGMLELLPLKYYNAEDDHQLRNPFENFRD